MPRVAQRASVPLKVLCMENIAFHLDRIWCKEFLQRYYGTAHFKFVLGPFDDLPPSLIQELWVFLKTRKLIRKHHIYLLISPFSKSLDFSSCDVDLTLMLLLTGQRCFSLRQLNLSGCKLPKTQFSETLPLLTAITVLSLSRSTITDSLLSIVGLYCPNLLTLDISYCIQVSDCGLLTLFLPQDAQGNRIQGRFGCCVSITKLLVAGSQNITDSGATEALINLPNLTVFDYYNTVSVITRLHNQSKVKCLKLKTLHCSAESRQNLSLAISVCPSLEHLFIVTHSDLQDDVSLLGLLDLAQLRELRVCNEMGEFSLPVLSHLGPVLQSHGDTLVSLNLAEVQDIDVRLLAATCPSLLHLVLLWNKSYLDESDRGRSSSSRSCFVKLRTVEVACREDTEEEDHCQMSYEHIATLLNSSQLRQLKLSNCNKLTDELMINVLTENGLSNLEKLELNNCDYISMDGLELLLMQRNPLDSVNFVKCEWITLSQFQTYQKKVKKMKWKISLDWS